VTRPAHLNIGLIALVAAGGAVGTLGRYGLAQAVPAIASWPVATLLANLVGAALLGMLLEALVRRGPESSRARRLRLTLGTGALGGFTTFSSLAYEVERLLAGGNMGTGIAYALTSVVLGLAACLAGVAWSAKRHRVRQAGTLPSDPDASELLDSPGSE
jgi:fluoride exporter